MVPNSWAYLLAAHSSVPDAVICTDSLKAVRTFRRGPGAGADAPCRHGRIWGALRTALGDGCRVRWILGHATDADVARGGFPMTTVPPSGMRIAGRATPRRLCESLGRCVC